VGRRIWVVVPAFEGSPAHAYDCRVLSLKAFLPAGPVGEGEPNAYEGIRRKHLLKLWTDPGGNRVLTVGSIRLHDPMRTGEITRAQKQLSSEKNVGVAPIIDDLPDDE
jgi:hypothetical protein